MTFIVLYAVVFLLFLTDRRLRLVRQSGRPADVHVPNAPEPAVGHPADSGRRDFGGFMRFEMIKAVVFQIPGS